jgi:HEPN domain-containing protein
VLDVAVSIVAVGVNKSMKKPQRTLHTDIDVRATVLCGDAFYRLAQPFITSVPSDRAQAQRYAAENIGDMSAAAVNLAFALEIYLKALIAGTGRSFPNEHSLLVLFDELPEDVRDRVKADFDTATSDQRASDTETAALLVEVTRQGSKRLPTPPKPFPKGVRALLQRNARNFLAWRYLFASETKEGIPLSFEFHNMAILAKILRRCFPEDIRMEVERG